MKLSRDLPVYGPWSVQNTVTNKCGNGFADCEFDYNYKIGVLDTKWHEPKTLDTYAMPRISDSKRWWFDFYHMMGAYAMCSKGLFRDEEEQIAQGWNILCSQSYTG